MSRDIYRRPSHDLLLLAGLNGASGFDSSFNNRTPTVGAGVAFGSGVADFNGGSTASITYPDNTEAETFPLSMMCWVRIDTYTQSRSLISKVTSSTNYIGWHFYYAPGLSRGLAFGHTNHTGLPVVTNYRQAWTASSALTAGPWYHVAATIAAYGNVPALYVNGVSQSVSSAGLGSIASQANSEPIRVGGLGGPDFSYYHDGGLADVRIYNRVLTAAEIAGIHASTSGVTRP